MKVISGPSALAFLPLDGNGSDIVDGALIAPGTTAGQDLGVFIACGAAGADVIAVKEGLHDFSEVGDSTPEDGAAHVLGRCNLIKPGAILAAEYDQSDTIATDSNVDSTSVTATSLEDNIDSSWIYFVSGTGIGQLAYVTASASGDATIKAALTTNFAEGDTFIKILRPGHGLVKLTTDRSQIGSDAAAGSGLFRIIENQVKYKGSQGWETLNPTKHHGLTGLDGKFVKFRALMTPMNSFFTPND